VSRPAPSPLAAVSSEERDVLDSLDDALEGFVSLPRSDDLDLVDFERGVRELRRIVYARRRTSQ
jgi:hypothetical protein